jgi:hypothetical protein
VDVLRSYILADFISPARDWLRAHLVKPLARAVYESSILLGLAAVVIKTFEGYDWRDVFLSGYFLTIVTVILLYLLRDVYHYRAVIPRKQRYQAYPILLVMIAACVFMSWKAWSFTYNPIGIYENRNWHSKGGNETEWRWNIRGATDKRLNVIIRFKVCSRGEIDKLFPEPVTLFSPDSSETGFQEPNYREWTVKGLQRPAEVQFVLVLKKAMDRPDQCITHQIFPGD